MCATYAGRAEPERAKSGIELVAVARAKPVESDHADIGIDVPIDEALPISARRRGERRRGHVRIEKRRDRVCFGGEAGDCLADEALQRMAGFGLGAGHSFGESFAWASQWVRFRCDLEPPTVLGQLSDRSGASL